MAEPNKATTKLVISGPDGTEQVALDPKGATLGRDASCDIVLDHFNISRLHARISLDPFGRWIIEDLDSRNGVFVEEKRIITQAVMPNQKITIYPFTLSLSQEFEQRIDTDTATQPTVDVVDKGLEENIVAYQADREGILSTTLIRRLNEVTAQLLELSSPSELYSQASYHLAKMLDALVAFVRLGAPSDSRAKPPRILACNFSKDTKKGELPQESNIHFSKRVLETVRKTNTPVMARSGPSAEKQLVLTIVDEVTPHIVFAAPVNVSETSVDALYVDMLEDKSPDEMFDFVEAIARQISSVQKSLVSAEAKAERRLLDEQLTLARDIQSKLVHRNLQGRFEVDVAVCYEPAMWVGGDYYGVWPLDGGKIAFAVADVSGKGLPAAMIMSNIQAALSTTLTFCPQLSTVAEHINNHLCQNLRDDMFVTLFLGIFDPAENKLSYVNAGHIAPLIMQPDQPAKPLGKPANLPLGIFEEPFEMQTEIIGPDASLLVVTDGITECGNPDGEQFEMQRLGELMTDLGKCSAEQLVRSVVKGVTDFRRTLAQQDDITVFALVNRKREKI